MRRKDPSVHSAIPARLSRRRLIKGLVGASAAFASACVRGRDDEIPTADLSSSTPPMVPTVAGYEDPDVWDGRTLVIATPGEDGSDYADAQARAIFEPFQRLTGAVIRTDRVDVSELESQVNEADVTWSVCDIPAEDVLPLANSAIISEIDYSIVDSQDLFNPLVLSHGVGVSLYSMVMSFYEGEGSTGPAPTNWGDFWDTVAFPGMRGLQESPIGTLEFALLASGVPKDSLYPLDVNSAFEMLDDIRDQIALWWRQGAQSTQMIAAGDLVMVATWQDRIAGLIDGGEPVGFTWNQSQINGNCWVVPNGAPNHDVAMDFINFATRPEVCAAFSQLFPFGPMNRAAFDFLDEEAKFSLPGAPGVIAKQFVIDLEWWFRNGAAVDIRFQEWLAAEPDDS